MWNAMTASLSMQEFRSRRRGKFDAQAQLSSCNIESGTCRAINFVARGEIELDASKPQVRAVAIRGNSVMNISKSNRVGLRLDLIMCKWDVRNGTDKPRARQIGYSIHQLWLILSAALRQLIKKHSESRIALNPSLLMRLSGRNGASNCGNAERQTQRDAAPQCFAAFL